MCSHKKPKAPPPLPPPPPPPKSTLKQVKSTAGSTSEGWNIFEKMSGGGCKRLRFPEDGKSPYTCRLKKVTDD